MLVVLHRDPSIFYRARWQPAWLALVAFTVALIVTLSVVNWKVTAQARVMVRNFYGGLRVIDLAASRVVLIQGSTPRTLESASPRRKLMNGTIDHGLQFLAPDRRRQPTTYYGPNSGIGLALREAGQRRGLSVGVIGLGTGTLASYGRPGEHYIFYEINPLVIRLANTEFSFLRDSEAKVEIVQGDARLSLEREPAQAFDVLAVDAFSGDAIPVHLLTREAFALYFRQLKSSGVLAMNITNRYVDLEPVVQGVAESLRKRAIVINNEKDDGNGIFLATWILISGRQEFFDVPEIKKAALRSGEGLTCEFGRMITVICFEY